jgi:YidC/Oxa1 family membrane protein insertase
MEKRVLITILLSICVMYGYSFLVTTPPKKESIPAVKVAQKQISSSVGEISKKSDLIKLPETVTGQAAKNVVVDTDLYHAEFTTAGAALKKFVLKKYGVGTDPKSERIKLIDEQRPEDFSLQTYININGFPNERFAVYSVNNEAIKVSKGEKRQLEFVASLGSGVIAKKVYTFNGDGYAIGLEYQAQNTSGSRVEGTIQLVEKSKYVKVENESSYDVHGPTTFADDALHTQKLKDLEKGAISYSKNILWSGFEDKYFLSAVLAQNGSMAAVQVKQNGEYVENIISSPKVSLGPGEAATISYRVFMGPKDFDVLKAQGNSLEEVIDFGWFSAIAKPLLHTLKFFYRYVGNYGIAIIIITVILKVLFYPLTNKSFKSMKEMQKLQPKMEALKEKFKNDREAMNKAVMEMYKTHKVNPMGGCLPMIIQIPVFFALYKALMFSIELRHAPFMLWINDLSAPDALFGVIPKGIPLLGGFPVGPLPLLMGATMVIQQKMTPSNMDPAQAKMMMALPFIFTFMFFNFPSGLVLYWLVNNILTIAQQFYINKNLQES